MTAQARKTRDRTAVSFDIQCPWCGAEVDGYNNLMPSGGGTIESQCACGARISVRFDIEAPRDV